MKSDSPRFWTLAPSLLVGCVGLSCFLLTLAMISSRGQRLCSSCLLSRPELLSLQVIIECIGAAGAGWVAVKVIRRRAGEGFWNSIQWRQSTKQVAVSGAIGLCASVLMRYAMTGRFTLWLNGGVGINRLFLLIFIGTVILQPFIEEVYFRGILFCGLRSRFNSWVSVAIVTLIFVALHAQHQWIVLPIGILLGAVRVIAGSTCNCFALHLSYNLGVVLWGIR